MAYGLPDTARVKRNINNGLTIADTLLALAVDYLALLVWFQTKDGQKNRNRPKSVLDALSTNKPREERAFATGKDFEEERRRILKQLQEEEKNA